MTEVTTAGPGTYRVTFMRENSSLTEVVHLPVENWPDEPEFAAEAIVDDYERAGSEVIEVAHVGDDRWPRPIYTNRRFD